MERKNTGIPLPLKIYNKEAEVSSSSFFPYLLSTAHLYLEVIDKGSRCIMSCDARRYALMQEALNLPKKETIWTASLQSYSHPLRDLKVY